MPTLYTSAGATARPLPGLSSLSYLRTVIVRVFSSINQSMAVPVIEQNTRSGDTELNRLQIIPTRDTQPVDRVQIMSSYTAASQSLDAMSKVDRQIFNRVVTANVASTKDTKLVLSSLLHNYGRTRR